MTEEQAQNWIVERFGAATKGRLDQFADRVITENARQNLISPASVATIWSRHIVDSLQLLPLATQNGPWVDIGTGGGFPGLAVAIAANRPVILVEPRRKRADFLRACADQLGLTNVEVATAKIDQVPVKAAVISARAVASIENLLRAAAHCATPETQWLLPRGSVDRAELASMAARNGMMFHVEQSLTQAESAIVVLKAR